MIRSLISVFLAQHAPRVPRAKGRQPKQKCGSRNLRWEQLEERTVLSGSPVNIAIIDTATATVVGQADTFTAIVTAGDSNIATPTGFIEFDDGAAVLGTATLDNTGVAAFTTSLLALGSHTITAKYSGDINFASGANTTGVADVVSPASTMTTLAAANASSVVGQNVTFTATVAAALPGSGTPTGSVEFDDGSTVLGKVALGAQGTASFQTSTLTIATHTITAKYLGDTNYLASSGTASQTVAQAATLTTLSVLYPTGGSNSAVIGQYVVFSAKVAVTSPGAAGISGTIDFVDGTTVLATRSLGSSGAVTYVASGLSVGVHSITAIYHGNASLAGSTSTPLTESINQGATSTFLYALPPVSIAGQSVMLVAYVSAQSPAWGARTGSVSFYDGTTLLSTVALGSSSSNSVNTMSTSGYYSGVATYTTTTLSIGSHSLTAVYNGDPNFLTSTSKVVTEQVVTALSRTSLTSSAESATQGTAVTFTATVKSVLSSTTSSPTGSVQFYDGQILLGNGTLNASGVATFTTSTLTVGNHSISAQYQGDSTFGASTGYTYEHIKPIVLITSTTISGAGTTNAGAQTFSINVSSNLTSTGLGGGFGGSPTGSLSFTDTAKSVNLVSSKILFVSLAADGQHATIYGYGKLNGKSNVYFQVQVGATSATQTFELSFGGPTGFYDSGANPVDTGGTLSITTTTTPKSNVTQKSIYDQFWSHY